MGGTGGIVSGVVEAIVSVIVGGLRTRYRRGVECLVGHQHQAPAIVVVTSLPTTTTRLLLSRLDGNTETFR
jgi:hypothetical protein